MDFWFLWIGRVVCIGCGLLAVGFFIGLCLNYFWRKLKDVHSFDRLCKLLREDAKRSSV
jgi:hypothetical protein